MRTKVTLVLVFLNVALFFFIFKFERGWRTEQASLEARRRVLGPETADLRTIRIDGPGLTPVNLVRTGENWALTEPLEWPANPHAVSRIVNELQFLEHETSFSVADLERNNQSLADYGLEQPKLSVTFTAGNTPGGDAATGAPVTLQIGDETKVGNRLYVLSPDGRRVHVVSLSLVRSLSLSLDELRADTVFSIPVFEARSLSLQNAANLRVRIRRDGNRWQFEAPIIARASKLNVELAINGLNALRVRSFVDRGAADANPATGPALRITLEGNNRRETLLLGDEIGSTAIPAAATDAAPGTAATKPDVEFHAMLEGKSTLFTVSLPGALIDALRHAQEVLRETRILDFDPAAVTAITLAAPNRPELTLQRLETGAPTLNTWQLVRRESGQGPQTLPADSDTVRQLLEKLSLLSALKFVSDAPSDADLENWGFNRPEREITLALGTGTGGAAAKLQIGDTIEATGQAYARLSNARFVYLVDAAILRAAPVAPLDYRDKLVRALPAAARISAVRITDLSDDSTLLDQALPADQPVENQALARLLPELRSLRAVRFVQEGFPEQILTGGEERPWRYRLNATVVLPGGSGEQTEEFTLFFSPRTGGATQLAGSPQLGVVFAVTQPLLDALWEITYGDQDPGAPAPPPAETAPAPTPPVDD
ncbi:MAG: DUF4340 domain-containing protein [Opitutaceae bacterium]|nr:DUF4340 domain-containing protein [Opitutaceae bacterium]